LKACFQDR